MKLDAYKLKLIAIIAMFFNHMVIAWWVIIPEWLRFPMYAVGGITFPVLAYFVVEGYRHTSSLKRYVLRLLGFGLLAMPFHIVAISVSFGGGHPNAYPWLNIMFTIAASLGVLALYDKIKSRVLFWLLYVVVIVPLSFFLLEWYFIGPTTVLLFYVIKKENVRRVVAPLFAGVMMFLGALLPLGLPESMLPEGFTPLVAYPGFPNVMATFAIGCVAAAILLLNYNGQRGKKMKWLFYAFYPLHFVLLAVVALALGFVDLSFFGI